MASERVALCIVVPDALTWQCAAGTAAALTPRRVRICCINTSEAACL